MESSFVMSDSHTVITEPATTTQDHNIRIRVSTCAKQISSDFKWIERNSDKNGIQPEQLVLPPPVVFRRKSRKQVHCSNTLHDESDEPLQSQMQSASELKLTDYAFDRSLEEDMIWCLMIYETLQ